jgi:hypothetical protein
VEDLETRISYFVVVVDAGEVKRGVCNNGRGGLYRASYHGFDEIIRKDVGSFLMNSQIN